VDHPVGIVITIYPSLGNVIFGYSVTKTRESLLTILVSGVRRHTIIGLKEIITIKLTSCKN